ncbi:hypothetical protein ONZ45_g12023 [Pleurotus djamor]|nr:hypothetical protein ONZ45_g12023 [Pleurotus djamor]
MKVATTPGLPVDLPSTPYWAIPPSEIARHGADDPFPPMKGSSKATSEEVGSSDAGGDADVVIIGSGVTGAAVARTILDWDAQRVRDRGGMPLRVVMLEARDACSGATARNGGHITPPLYHDYSSLKKELGAPTAQRIIRFRLAHLAEFLKVAEEEGLLVDSQGRKVQTFDVFFDKKVFEEAKGKLEEYKKDMPVEGADYCVLDADDGVDLVEEYQLSPRAVGCISTIAGAIHPYRLVTDVATDSTFYTLTTSKGTIRTPHVVHATNGWASHLLEPLRGKIVPLRATMTSQRPGVNLGSPTNPNNPLSSHVDQITNTYHNELRDKWIGTRSFVFYPTPSSNVWDYLTQMPAPPSAKLSTIKEHSPSRSEASTALVSDNDSILGSSETAAGHEWDTHLTKFPQTRPLTDRYPSPAGELMFGGGLGQSENAFFDSLGNTDDRDFYIPTASYLSGALPLYFSGWGQEGRDEDVDVNEEGHSHTHSNYLQDKIEPGRVKSVWTGILGMSADGMPWVGRLPDKLSGRRAPRIQPTSQHPTPQRLAAPGEWIAAGYTGEGMVHAWMSAKAVAFMILDADAERSKLDHLGHPSKDEEDWLPKPYIATEKRWKEADIDKLIEGFLP